MSAKGSFLSMRLVQVGMGEVSFWDSKHGECKRYDGVYTKEKAIPTGRDHTYDL